MVYTIDGKNPALEVLTAYNALTGGSEPAVGKDLKLYLGVRTDDGKVSVPPAHRSCVPHADPSDQSYKSVSRIAAGSISRGALLLEAETGPLEGDTVEASSLTIHKMHANADHRETLVSSLVRTNASR